MIINPTLWPDPVSFDESFEPIVLGTIVIRKKLFNLI
jgi:hypothetical protein